MSVSCVRHARKSLLPLSLLTVSLGGCTTLPSSGPTASRIEREAASPGNRIGYHIREIGPETLSADAPAATPGLGIWPTDLPAHRSDIIRPGDTLSITVYEVGISLFGGVANIAAAGMGPQVDAPSAQRIGTLVDDEGRVRLPFAGSLTVAGRTPEDVQQEIEARLRVNSQHPQALVAIADSVGSSVYLSGTVARPGRMRLTAARERLLDMIAQAGGPTADKEDTEVHVVRDGRAVQVRLGDIQAEDAGNIMLLPGDRIELIRNQRTYSVFGATDKVSQIPFSTHAVSLSDAIARAGGPSDMRANPKSVFLFRYEPDTGGAAERPVIYRLDMMNPQSYFLAQRFAVRNGDVLYFSNSASNMPTKFIALLNQLFSPFVTARVLTR